MQMFKNKNNKTKKDNKTNLNSVEKPKESETE